MFSALSRVVDLLLGSGEPLPIPSIEHKSLEPAAPAITETKHFCGRVTSIHEGYGLIDGDVYFKNAVVNGNTKPQVGDMVYVTASRQHEQGGWKASVVAPLSKAEILRLQHQSEKWDDDDYDDGDIQLVCATSHRKHTGSESTDGQEDALVAVVTSMHPSGGYLNDTVWFNLDDVRETFIPHRRDWVTAKVVTDLQTDVQTAVDVKPLRQQDFEGSIEHVSQGFGFIEGDIYFTFEVCEEDYVPRRCDRVCGTAVETSQGKNQWRAIRVEPMEDVHDVVTR